MSSLTDTETIAALTAKCALLAASLAQAEAEGHKATKAAAVELEECAALMDCYSGQLLALFQVIDRYTDTGKFNMEPLSIGERQTVAQLAGVGVYLADHAYSVASDYQRTAKEMRGAA